MRQPSRAGRAVTGLTAVQIFALLAGLVTGPLLARALGPVGRGQLAALQTPLGLVPFVLQFGLSAFAAREVARGTDAALLLGSLGPPLVLVGVLTAALSPALVAVLLGDGSTVGPYLTAGLILTPLVLVMSLGADLIWGLQRWRVLMVVRVAAPAVTLLAFVALTAASALTLASASLVVLLVALSTVPIVGPQLWRFGRPRFDRRLLREGASFGARAWPGTLAQVTNGRLDQLLMIPLVPARQLGLYAVAVTVSSIGGYASTQLVTVLYPRLAAGGPAQVAQAVRLGLAAGLLSYLVVGAASAVFLTLLFGEAFADARSLVWILCLGGLSLTGATVLGQALAAAGRPGIPSLGEVTAVVVTVPGLILLLPSLQARGAAIVSAAAYTINFAIQLWLTERTYRLGLRSYLLLDRSDVERVRATLFRPSGGR